MNSIMYRLNATNAQQAYLRDEQKTAIQRQNHQTATHESQQYPLAAEATPTAATSTVVLPSHIFLQQQQQQESVESSDIRRGIHSVSDNTVRRKNEGLVVVCGSRGNGGGQPITITTSFGQGSRELDNQQHPHHLQQHHPHQHQHPHQPQHHLSNHNHSHGHHRQQHVSDAVSAAVELVAATTASVTATTAVPLSVSCHSGSTLTSTIDDNAEIVSNSTTGPTPAPPSSACLLTSMKADTSNAAAAAAALYLTEEKLQLLTADIKSEPLNELGANLVGSGGVVLPSSTVLPLVGGGGGEDDCCGPNGLNIKKMARRNLTIVERIPSSLKSPLMLSNTSASVASKLDSTEASQQQPVPSISFSGGGSGVQRFVTNNDTNNGSGNNTNNINNSTEDLTEENLDFISTKRTRLDVAEEWISGATSPGSVVSPVVRHHQSSPSSGSQNQLLSGVSGGTGSGNTSNLSNGAGGGICGYASPMSVGSYEHLFSPNGKTGREDLSPSNSLNGYVALGDVNDVKKIKKGPAPRLQEELCLVCGDRASGYHYNALTCEGCKGFFRRSVTKNAVYCCKFGHACEMDMYMRRKCQECRLKKCLAVGMRPECVVPENQCALKRREKKAQKEKDKLQNHASSSSSCSTEYIKKEILDLMTCEPPTHPTCPLLPEDILAKCQARNIPPLTYNQLAVIYKLIWYQDGYEQPSEEDLKRIMVSSPDENESQHDVSFRHITEITILTVQLIVEFAKGLPAFTKIPQEDQITLLKACSSEVMMLRMARRYDHNSDSIFFANNRSYTRDSYKMAGMADNIEDLLHFCRQMYSMKVDNVEYALLTAIVIFSDRPGLEKAELVEAIQSYYIDTLRIYILNRHCGDPMSLVFFAKLLSILTELRTLGNQNAEMCFSLKLKNRKLPKFLEEIWDVHAIPPSVQSHIQATQAEKQAASSHHHQSMRDEDLEVGEEGDDELDDEEEDDEDNNNLISTTSENNPASLLIPAGPGRGGMSMSLGVVAPSSTGGVLSPNGFAYSGNTSNINLSLEPAEDTA